MTYGLKINILKSRGTRNYQIIIEGLHSLKMHGTGTFKKFDLRIF